MVNYQSTEFSRFAGQLVQNGVLADLPINSLEESYIATNVANTTGLSNKIADVFIRETRIFNNPLDTYFTKFSSRFGAGLEQAVYDPADNHIATGTGCFPQGNPTIHTQTDYINFAYNVSVSVSDREFSTKVLDEGQLGSVIAQKLRTPYATISNLKYRAEVQLLSDIVDGTRTIASKTYSDNTGVDVQYNPTIKGYAGTVENAGVSIKAPERGALIDAPTTADALKIARMLEGRSADFSIPASDGNKDGAVTFCTSRPLMVAETKTLNALDQSFVDGNAVSNASYQIGPTTFRAYCNRFADIVEIDSFADIPTTSEGTYSTQRIGAVLVDRDALIEQVNYEPNVESFRCTAQRSTGWSYMGASTLSIARMLNSYALTFNTE